MISKLSNTKLRPFSLDDAEGVVNLINRHSQAILGVKDTDLDEMVNDWTSPGVAPDEMIRVLEDDQGTIIGYIDVWDISKPHVTKYIWGVLDPEYWDDDCFRYMLRWAEEFACSRIPLAPDEARVVMNMGLSNKDLHRMTALENYGFELVRNFFRMEIDLDHAPQTPIIPEGLTVRPIHLESELRAALIAMEDGFSDHWGHVDRSVEELLEQWQHFIDNSNDFDPSLWFLAMDGDKIAGVCRCKNKMTEDPDMGWVNQLCVRKAWRRQGLGMALLLTGFSELYRRGKARIGLGVDATSLTNATRLYEKAGMHVTQQYGTYEKELRPGKDIVLKSLAA
jgi:ribosomal protein S18 acetylase RimI-like enzyme